MSCQLIHAGKILAQFRKDARDVQLCDGVGIALSLNATLFFSFLISC